MSRYLVRASNSAGAVSGMTQYDVTGALKKAIEYRDGGFRNIILTNVGSGVEVALDQFMRDHPDA